MKIETLTIALFLMALTQVHCQSEDDVDLPMKQESKPIVETSKDELKAYAKNPKNKPKLDFTPKGTQQQPKSAGVSGVKTSGQIIGGAAAAQKQFPWQAVLLVDDSWICGGSLIASNWVMTAAHCVYGARSYLVSLGGIVRKNTAENGEKSMTSKTAIYHEKYSEKTLANDIAVIKLPQNVALDDFINLIRLPSQAQATTTFVNNTLTASGYGLTYDGGSASNLLNFVSLVVISNTRCAAVYGTSTVTSSVICTAADAKKTICSGDSGGPLVLKESDGKFTQIGVVSFGAAASCINYPSGYSRVSSFLGWISQKTGISVRRRAALTQ